MPEFQGTAEQTSRSWRPRLRFSLRTLLIAITLFSACLGLVVNRVRNEQRAAEAIAAAHGQIVYDWQIRPPKSPPNSQPTPPGPQWLRKLLGPHWLDRIVEVRLNAHFGKNSKNRFAVVGPHLAGLHSLRSLTLSDLTLDQNDYRLLGQLTQLKTLRLWQHAGMSSQDAAALARNTGLRELDLNYAKVSPQALTELAKFPNLEVLDITCDSFDPSTAATLKEHFLTDEAAEAIATFPKLRSLMLFYTRITDDGIAALSRLSTLEKLSVSSPHITSASFDHVAKLSRLEHLGTWQWKIDDAHFEKLAHLPRLRGLGLRTNLTDESVPYITKLDRIEHLALDGEGITDASLHHLARLKHLEWLDARSTSVTKHGQAVKELKQALPNCKMLLPKTEREKRMEASFHNWKWGGGSTVALPVQKSAAQAGNTN